MDRKQVIGESGLCSAGAAHHLCRGVWMTPSVDVTCGCACHKAKTLEKKSLEPKGKIVPKKSGKVLVPKK